MNEEHIAYAITQLQAGYSKDVILQELIRVGYTEELSNQLISVADAKIHSDATANPVALQEVIPIDISRIHNNQENHRVLLVIILAILLMVALGVSLYLLKSDGDIEESKNSSTDVTQNTIPTTETPPQFQLYSDGKEIQLEVPQGWRESTPTTSPDVLVRFQNPNALSEQILVTRNDVPGMRSAVLLDMFKAGREENYMDIFETVIEVESKQTEVAGLPARRSTYAISINGVEQQLEIIYLYYNESGYSVSYVSNPNSATKIPGLFDRVVSSFTILLPLDKLKYVAQNDALFNVKDKKYFISIVTAEMFADSFKHDETLRSENDLFCLGLSFTGVFKNNSQTAEYTCSDTTEHFVIEFKIPSGYYCIDSTGKSRYGNQTQITDNLCLDSAIIP